MLWRDKDGLGQLRHGERCARAPKRLEEHMLCRDCAGDDTLRKSYCWLKLASAKSPDARSRTAPISLPISSLLWRHTRRVKSHPQSHSSNERQHVT